MSSVSNSSSMNLKSCISNNISIFSIQKNVRISPTLQVFEIPTRAEYEKRNLSKKLWIPGEELLSYRIEAKQQIVTFAAKNPDRYLVHKDPLNLSSRLIISKKIALIDLTDCQIAEEEISKIKSLSQKVAEISLSSQSAFTSLSEINTPSPSPISITNRFTPNPSEIPFISE